jgi:hypothetical protein
LVLTLELAFLDLGLRVGLFDELLAADQPSTHETSTIANTTSHAEMISCCARE